MNKHENHKAPRKFEVIEFPRSDGFASAEEEIEARLHDVHDCVNELSGSSYAVVLAEGTPLREAFDELCVKEAALEWIVRAAKHSTGGVREKLWTDIDNAVADLEVLAESLTHPVAAERRPGEIRRYQAAIRRNLKNRFN